MDTSELILPECWKEENPDVEKALEEFLSEPRRKRQKVPAGYTWDGESEFCYPHKEVQLKIIEALIDNRFTNRRSLREAMDYLRPVFEEQGLTPITTAGGLSNVFTKIEKRLGIDGGKTSSYERLKAQRQRRIAERKKEGRARNYNYSRKQQEFIDRQKDLTRTNHEILRLKKAEAAAKAKAARHAAKLKLSGDPTKFGIEEEEKPKKKQDASVQRLEGSHATADVPQDREVAFAPNPGPQTEFLSADEDIVLYGGAAGGGKSYAMVVDPLRFAHKKNHRAVIIRKTMPELKELIDVSRELYTKYDPKAKFRETDHTWTFSSGAQIMFRFLDRPADKYKFQGIAYTYIGFDELSQHETPEGFNYLRTRMRSAKAPGSDDGIKCYIRATANPGSMWVYDMFIKDREPNKAFILPGSEDAEHPVTVKFIPAKLEDNPYLDEDGKYRSILQSLDDTLRRQLLEGDWLASADNMFTEFDYDVHVIDNFDIPRHWNRIAGLDYGYKDPAAAVWMAIDPEDGSVIVYDEFMQRGLTGREFALAIKEKEAYELVPVDHPIDWSIYARTGHTGPTIAESMLQVPGFQIRKADKNREAGWIQVHELLRRDSQTGFPKMRIFRSCKSLIKQLMSVKVHDNKPGDIDQTRNSDGHWDLLDALRYAVMSRPRRMTYEDALLNAKTGNTWNKYRGYFR